MRRVRWWSWNEDSRLGVGDELLVDYVRSAYGDEMAARVAESFAEPGKFCEGVRRSLQREVFAKRSLNAARAMTKPPHPPDDPSNRGQQTWVDSERTFLLIIVPVFVVLVVLVAVFAVAGR